MRRCSLLHPAQKRHKYVLHLTSEPPALTFCASLAQSGGLQLHSLMTPFPVSLIYPRTPTPDNILEELIKDNVLRQRLTQLAAAPPALDGTNGTTPQAGAVAASPSPSAPGVPSDEGLFSDYASGIVNTVMHFFKVQGGGDGK